MEEHNNVIIENFDLKFFIAVVEQNLMVDNQISIKFDKDIIKSIVPSISQYMLKLWTAPLKNFIVSEPVDSEYVLNFDDEEETPEPEENSFEEFDMYVLNGSLFKRMLKIFGNEPVKLEFDIDKTSNVATSLKITGTTNFGSNLSTTYLLTSDELIVNKVSDYNKVIESTKPAEGMVEFILTVDELKELKSLIKDLHKTISQNSSYITFDIDVVKKIITISDKAFKVVYPLYKTQEDENKIEKSFSFNLMKSDFINTGSHTFKIMTLPEDQSSTAIMYAYHKKCVIACILSKAISVDSDNNMSNYIADQSTNIDDFDLNIDDYFD